MWKGGISFGLVMIPVRLYAATEQKDIAFRQVHRADGGRIRFRRFCSVCGEEVPYEDVVKGYELPTGEMVVLDDEDLADLPLPTTKSIEVLHFAPAEQLDPILFNRSYFVEPEAAGARAYVLLRDALEQSGRIAIAQVALRQRESLATLRSRDGVLVLETLLWPDEVRDASFPFLEQDIEVRPQELTMASSLIDSMTSDFDALRASLAAAQQAPAVGGKDDEAKAIGDGSKTGAAKSRSSKDGPSKPAAAKAGTAKGVRAKSGTAKDEPESGDETAAKEGSPKTRQSRAKSGPAKPARKAS
jgi:DNA end-binding protein Ku